LALLLVVSALVQSQESSEETTTSSEEHEHLDQLNSTSGYTLSIDESTENSSSLASPMDSSEPPLSFLTKRVRRAAQEMNTGGVNVLNQTESEDGSINGANPPTMAPVADSPNTSSQYPLEDVHYGSIDGPISDDNSTSESYNGEFTCNDRKFGYYADEGRNCSYYHLCIPVTLPIFRQRTYYQRLSFICADNTWFDQTVIRCAAAPSIPCSDSHKYYEQSSHLLLNNTSTESPTYAVPATMTGNHHTP